MLSMLLAIALTQDVTVTARETPTRIAIGSGVIFDRQGSCYLVATASHVVKNKTELTVKCSQGIYPATLQCLSDDIYHDVAVLRIRARAPLPVAQLATEPLQNRTTVTLGESTGVLESVGGMPCMRLSRAARHGESGAAVYQDGKIVGIFSSSLGDAKTMCWFTSAARVRLMIRGVK